MMILTDLSNRALTVTFDYNFTKFNVLARSQDALECDHTNTFRSVGIYFHRRYFVST